MTYNSYPVTFSSLHFSRACLGPRNAYGQVAGRSALAPGERA